MALIKCKECGNQISSQALTCPHCGIPIRMSAAASPPAKPKQKTSAVTSIIAGVLGLSVLIGVFGTLFPPKPSETATAAHASPSPAKKKADPRDVAKQPARKALIAKMLSNGLIKKIEGKADSPSVWVTPLFMAQDYDAKKSMMGTVYAYYVTEEPELLFVTIMHTKTGKRIGMYNEYGLDLDS